MSLILASESHSKELTTMVSTSVVSLLVAVKAHMFSNANDQPGCCRTPRRAASTRASSTMRGTLASCRAAHPIKTILKQPLAAIRFVGTTHKTKGGKKIKGNAYERNKETMKPRVPISCRECWRMLLPSLARMYQAIESTKT